MKILGIYDSSAPKYHRILLPCYGLQQQCGAEVTLTYDIKEELFKDIDILFLNRMIGREIRKTFLGKRPFIYDLFDDIILWREKYGFKIVCDLDDHWILGQDHILYGAYKHHSISDDIVKYIKASDIVTVTHERLYKEVREAFPGKPVYVLPNCIPKIDQFLINKYPSKQVRLFWAGGNTHLNDLELLRRPLQLIKRDKVRFVIAGYKDSPEWKEMAKIYTTDSNFNTEVYEILPIHEYYKAYAHCDISLIPLIDNEFNSHKSNLKILEAANIAAPVVVSRVHPYLGMPEYLVNYVDAHRPWYAQINKLLNDEPFAVAQGLALQEYCDKHFNFDKITLERKQIFEQYGKTNIGNIPTRLRECS